MTGNIRYRLCYDTVINRANGVRRVGSQELMNPYSRSEALQTARYMNEVWGPGHWVEDETGERVEDDQ